MANFAIIGAAGYVAPRHMQAIQETGHQLVAALDKSDSVGIVDSYFPEARFFTEFERFDRHIDKLRRTSPDKAIQFVSVCSPNYLHDAHIRFAFRSGADAVCEKPLVLNPWNLDGLQEIERATGRRVHSILQLRHHPSLLRLKQQIDQDSKTSKYDVDLTYVTSRGRWYEVSWKGDESKSGGIATNIGVHFFDMLVWLFGDVQRNAVDLNTPQKAAGYLEFERARVRWFLSIDAQDLPAAQRVSGQRTFRSIQISGKEIEFSEGFADLHRVSYEKILSGQGFGLDDARAAIQITHDIRNSRCREHSIDIHPYAVGKK